MLCPENEASQIVANTSTGDLLIFRGFLQKQIVGENCFIHKQKNFFHFRVHYESRMNCERVEGGAVMGCWFFFCIYIQEIKFSNFEGKTAIEGGLM